MNQKGQKDATFPDDTSQKVFVLWNGTLGALSTGLYVVNKAINITLLGKGGVLLKFRLNFTGLVTPETGDDGPSDPFLV
jgi:hypothetical protein